MAEDLNEIEDLLFSCGVAEWAIPATVLRIAAREKRVRAAERARIRAQLLAIGEDEYHPMGRMRSLLRDLADRIAPEANSG